MAQLSSLKQNLIELVSFQSMLVQAECKWVALAIEYLLLPRERPSGFPFVLPYFEIMNRVLEIRALIKKIIEWNAEQNLAVKAVLDFYEYIEKLATTNEIKVHYFRLETIWNWFEGARNILAVSRHLKDDRQTTEPKSSVDLKDSMQKLLHKIKKETNGKDKKITAVSGIIISECTEHWEELTGEIKDLKGNDVCVVQHNGILENNHRWSRMHARRRTGRSRTTNDMAKYGALTAVLSNLENETYVKDVLGNFPDFVYELRSIGEDELAEAKKLIKPYHNRFLVQSSVDRVLLLHDFITILNHSERKDKVDVKNWLNRVEWANPLMTP